MKNARTLLLAAAALVAATAASARADWATGGTITEFLPGDFTNNAPENPANARTADGKFVFDKTAVFGGSFVDFEATFSAGQRNLQVVLYTGSVTGAYLAAVDFINTSNGTSASAFFSSPASGALAANARNKFAFDLGGSGDFHLSQTGSFTTYDHLAVTFAFDNPGDRLALDAVENPEPATWALFGLGAVGLAAFAARRRRAAAPKTA